jgi:hypothetical protein
MRPTNAELLRGVVQALNGVVLPDLRSPHPQMTALMAGRLLEHLIAREERLVSVLRERIPALRALLADLDPALSALARPTLAHDPSASLDALTAEDDALHFALESVLESSAGREAAALARIDALLVREAHAELPLYERLVKA